MDSGLLDFALALKRFDIPKMPAQALRDFRTLRRSLFTKCFLGSQKLRHVNVTQEEVAGLYGQQRGKIGN